MLTELQLTPRREQMGLTFLTISDSLQFANRIVISSGNSTNRADGSYISDYLCLADRVATNSSSCPNRADESPIFDRSRRVSPAIQFAKWITANPYHVVSFFIGQAKLEVNELGRQASLIGGFELLAAVMGYTKNHSKLKLKVHKWMAHKL